MPAHASTGTYNTLVYRITGLPETKAQLRLGQRT